MAHPLFPARQAEHKMQGFVLDGFPRFGAFPCGEEFKPMCDLNNWIGRFCLQLVRTALCQDTYSPRCCIIYRENTTYIYIYTACISCGLERLGTSLGKLHFWMEES